MRHVDSERLKNVYLINHARESFINKCNFKGKRYIQKVFNLTSLVDLDSLDERFDLLSSLNLEHSIIPEYITEIDGQVNGYLTELVLFYDIDSILNPLERYRALFQIKEALLELHKNGIVHGDVHSGNILSKDNTYCLSDFDNYECSSEGIHLNTRNSLFCARDFIEKNGITEDLDVFLFNILTFKVLSGVDYIYYDPKNIVNYAAVKDSIEKHEYGLFSSEDAIKICEAILTNTPSDYLLDTIEARDVKVYSLNGKKSVL